VSELKPVTPAIPGPLLHVNHFIRVSYRLSDHLFLIHPVYILLSDCQFEVRQPLVYVHEEFVVPHREILTLVECRGTRPVQFLSVLDVNEERGVLGDVLSESIYFTVYDFNVHDTRRLLILCQGTHVFI